MTTSSTGAPASAGASGRSATKAKSNGHKRAKTVTVRGVRLAMPERVPLKILQQLSQVAKAGDDVTLDQMVAALELILSPEEMDKLWAIEIPTGKDTISEVQDAFAEVIDKVFAAAGIMPGESSASSKP